MRRSGGSADFDDGEREQGSQWPLERLLSDARFPSWRPFLPHAIGWSAAAGRQGDEAALIELEHEGPRGHVFELADAVAPVPNGGQMDA